MPTISFSDFDVLEDVLAVDRFGVLIEPTTRSGLNQILAIRCTQIAVPEEMIEVMSVQLQGMEFSFRGRRTFDKTIGGSFLETTDAPVTKNVRGWMQDIVGSETHNGLKKKEYATLGTIEVYDQSGLTAMAYYVRNMWVSQIPGTTLEGGNAQPYLQQITFTYDKFYQDGVDEQ